MYTGLIHPSEKDKVNSFSDHRSQLISNLHFIFHTFLLQYLPSHAHIQYSLAIFFLHMHYFEIVKNINCTFSREVSLPFIQESQSSSAVTIFPSVTVFKANYSSKSFTAKVEASILSTGGFTFPETFCEVKI